MVIKPGISHGVRNSNEYGTDSKNKFCLFVIEKNNTFSFDTGIVRKGAFSHIKGVAKLLEWDSYKLSSVPWMTIKAQQRYTV
jgi:hypothetical protein